MNVARDRALQELIVTSDPTICKRCGWPLVKRIEDGCTKDNCSMRPIPPDRCIDFSTWQGFGILFSWMRGEHNWEMKCPGIYGARCTNGSILGWRQLDKRGPGLESLVCSMCKGRGTLNAREVTCWESEGDGVGFYPCDIPIETPAAQGYQNCPTCHGKGTVLLKGFTWEEFEKHINGYKVDHDGFWIGGIPVRLIAPSPFVDACYEFLKTRVVG